MKYFPYKFVIKGFLRVYKEVEVSLFSKNPSVGVFPRKGR
jgi:hypothetical protein